MAVDLERGKKRSCNDAEFPERSSGGQVLPGALHVDSSGNAAAPSSTPQCDGSAADPQMPVQGLATEPGQEAEFKELDRRAFVESQADAMVTELEGVSSRTAAAVEPPASGLCKTGDGSGVPGAYAKADKVAEEAE